MVIFWNKTPMSARSAKLPDQIRALSRRGSSNSLSKAGEVSSLEAPGIETRAYPYGHMSVIVCWLPLRQSKSIESNLNLFLPFYLIIHISSYFES